VVTLAPGFAVSNAAAIALSEAASEFVPQNEKLMAAESPEESLDAGGLPVAQPAASSTAAVAGMRRLRSFMRVLGLSADPGGPTGFEGLGSG